MPTRRPSVPGRGLCGLLVTLLALLLSAVAQAAAPPPEETVPLGESRERPIAAGESQAWRVTVPAETSVLVTVEQHSIDLVVEARRPGGKELLAVTASRDRWGSEVLLLDSPGESRIEVRSREKGVWPGRYTLRVDALPELKGAKRDALALMSRAGRETLPDTPDSRRQAEVTYREALAAWRSLGDRAWEAEALSSLAMLEAEASDLRPGTEDFLAALRFWQELGRPSREAEVLNWLGVIYLDTQTSETARKTLERALSIWHGLGERFDEAETNGNLCLWEHRFGSLQIALACHQENLAFFHGKGDQVQEAEILNRLGGVFDLKGEPDDALAFYEKALALWHSLGDHYKEATVLSNIAVVHRTLGEWQEALHFNDRARKVLGARGDAALAATLLNNTGFIYSSVGEPQRALGYLADALKLRRKVGDRAAEIITLNNLGVAWRRLGDLKQALDQHRQALNLAKSQGSIGQQAISWLRLAEVHLEQGDALASLRDLDAALELLRKNGNRRSQMEALHLQGRALVLAGRVQEALPVLQEALAQRLELRDRAGEAETLFTLASAERSLGLVAEALSHAEAAVSRVEELRTGFLSTDLRASFLATRRRAFSLLIDLRMDQHSADSGKGHDREAFAISERARARSLLDALRAGSAGHTGNLKTPELLARRSSLLRQLSAKADQRWKQSGGRAEALEKEIDNIRAELDEVEAEIRVQDSRFAAFSPVQPVSPAVIYGWLEPGTVLLEYSLGEERSFLWTVEAGQIRSFILPGQGKIEALARKVYEEMSTVEAGSIHRGDAERLSQILLGPIWSDSRATAPLRRLVVVPDGALAILPFAALPVPDPGRTWHTPGTLLPLLERLEVVSIPSATTLAAQRQLLQGRALAPKLAVVFADPVFAAGGPHLVLRNSVRQSRHGKASPKKPDMEAALRGDDTRGLPLALDPLPATRKEAEAVAALVPGKVTLNLGLAASREAALAGDLHDYRIIHFATHALADTQNPELSGLMLSQVDAEGHPREGFLGLSDIYELDLDADLVVLSGCRTALGKEVRGEGLMGLTRGFQYAGVPRVVASLWKVQDRATAELMSRFYRAMWRDHLPSAAALRQAQRSLRHDPRYKNSYFWAGFVLQGDWLGENARRLAVR
jgi:CHAT domain-containing protein/tetratricopeptide (TPR) repeat protein